MTQEELEDIKNDFIGLSLDEFRNINQSKYKHRVVMQDGQPFIVTMDFNMNRLNFTIENDLITNISLG